MPRKKENYVVVSAKNYGKKLHGIKIYYVGTRPSKLKQDGSISFGKLLLEIFSERISPFKWIITEDIDEIKKVRNTYIVKTSQKTISRLYSKSIMRSRDTKLDIVYEELAPIYPRIFALKKKTKYKSGLFEEVLDKSILSKLSSADKEALEKFIPEYYSHESITSISRLNAKTQIKTLKSISDEMKLELTKNRTESWWQDYIKNNILIIQQGYIYAIDKLNVGLGNTKYPDFSLITHDLFLDILEIKKPSTGLLLYDTSRDNYYWDSEIAKAIIQIENYIELISKNSENIRGYIKDKHKIDMKVVRPRGIILAGMASRFTKQKEKDDFRLLTSANKNISFLTYDELATRLDNYISVLNMHIVK